MTQGRRSADTTVVSTSDTPMSWGTEAVLLGVVHLGYGLVRNVAGGNARVAVANGEMLLGWKRALGLNLGHPLNALADASVPLAVVTSYFCASFHFVVRPAVLIWTVVCRPEVYRRVMLVSGTGIALMLIFVLPTAPPRLLSSDDGFVDIMVKTAAWGWWPAEQATSVSNPFAAMPSVHCLWALWCGYVLLCQARTRVVRTLGVAYPGLTGFVVLATGNHYLLDVVAALALALLVLALVGPLSSFTPRPDREPDAASVGSARGPDHGMDRTP